MTYETANTLGKAMLDLWGVQEILDALNAQGLEDSSALRLLSREVGEIATTIEGVMNSINDECIEAMEGNAAAAASMSANLQ